MSMGKLKYFFSYSRKDTEFVLKLATELRAVGVDVWLDQLDILGGQRWDRAIEDALKGCQGTIAVLSPESLSSNNVMDEVSYALEEGKLVVPILLRRCDIPFRLRLVQHVDFSIDYDLGFRQLLRALRVDQPPVIAEPPAVKAQTAQEFPESQAIKEPVVQGVVAEPQVDKTQVPQKLSEPKAVNEQAAEEFAEPQPVKTPVAREFPEPLAEPAITTARPLPSAQSPRHRLWAIAGILLIVWFLGFAAHLGGGVIHIVMLAAVVVLIYSLVPGRESKVRKATNAVPADATTGALARHPTRVGILVGAAAGVIWGPMAVVLLSPYSHFETMLVGMAIAGPAGAIAGAICKMRSRVISAATAGSILGWAFWANFVFSNRMTAAVFGTSIGVIVGSIAGVIIGRVKGWE